MSKSKIMMDPREMAAHGMICDDGSVRGPICCGKRMKNDGGCSEGCCDDYKCETCGKRIRVEWPD
jgi:hypothetical protein